MPKFVPRADEVEAEQWNGTKDDAERIVDWILTNKGWAQYKDEFFPPHILIDTVRQRVELKKNGWTVMYGPDTFECLTAVEFSDKYVASEDEDSE